MPLRLFVLTRGLRQRIIHSENRQGILRIEFLLAQQIPSITWRSSPLKGDHHRRAFRPESSELQLLPYRPLHAKWLR